MRYLKLLIFRKIGPNFVVLFYPISIIIVVSVLFIITIRLGYSNVTKQIASYEEAASIEQTLVAKYAMLRGVNSQILDATDKILIALPEKSPATWVISQIKTSALENSTDIGKFELDNFQKKESGLISMTLSFEGSSEDTTAFYTFLSTIDGMAPFSTFKEINVERNPGTDIYEFTSELDFYWSPLPETLPELDEPLKELSIEDREMLGRILGLREPSFTILEPSEPNQRQTPFN